MGRGGDPTGMGQGGGGEGGKGTGTNVEKQAPKKKSKFNCVVCSNKVNSNRDGSVQCGIYDLWWHPTCAQLSKEKFKLICMWMEQDGSSSPWKCASCDGAAAKVIEL